MSRTNRERRMERATRPRGRGGRTLAVLFAFAAHFLMLGPALWQVGWAADPEVKAILDRLPSGPKRQQAEWLMEEARSQTDANLALRVTEEALRRSDEGPAATEARLWRARYWIAAGNPARAMRELDLLDSNGKGSAERAEVAYWRALAGQPSGASDWGDLQDPPWNLLAALASVQDADMSRETARSLLGLESSVRRWGLVGPWLWRLSRGNAVETHIVEDLRDEAQEALARAPERAALLDATRPVPASSTDRAPVGSEEDEGGAPPAR